MNENIEEEKFPRKQKKMPKSTIYTE